MKISSFQPCLSHSGSVPPTATTVFNSFGGFHRISKLGLEEISLNSLTDEDLTYLLQGELVK